MLRRYRQVCIMSSTMGRPKQGAASPRERVLATASELFYRRGFSAVGVDEIVSQSGVAKMTLYRHFPSKDELIAALPPAAITRPMRARNSWAMIEELEAKVVMLRYETKATKKKLVSATWP